MAVGLHGLPSLGSVAGIRLGTVAAGIRKKDRRDLVLIECAPGTHAAGVVISKEPLTKYVPLQRCAKTDNQEAVMTQFSMNDIARIGLLKMHFLGLAILTFQRLDILRRLHLYVSQKIDHVMPKASQHVGEQHE